MPVQVRTIRDTARRLRDATGKIAVFGWLGLLIVLPLAAVFELQALRGAASWQEAQAVELATLRSDLNQAAGNVGWDMALDAPAGVLTELHVLQADVDAGIAALQANPLDAASVRAITASARQVMNTLTSTAAAATPRVAVSLIEQHGRLLSMVDAYAARLAAAEASAEAMFGVSVWAVVLLESTLLAGALWVGLARQRRNAVQQASKESRQRLGAVVDNAPVVAYAVDVDGMVTFLQGSVLEQVGIDPHELLGRSVTELFGDRNDVLNARRLMLSGERVHVQLQFSGRTWDIHGHLVQRPGAKPEVMGVAHDVTEVAAAQEALRRSEERLRALVENSSDLISVIGADGNTLFASPAVTDFSVNPAGAYRQAAILGVLEEDRPRVASLMSGLLEQPGEQARAQYRFEHPDGTVHWAESVGRNAVDNPAVQGIVVNTRDITELVRARDALEAREQELRAAHRRSEAALTLLETFQASAPVGFAFVDRGYRFARINDNFAKVIGCPAAALVGQSVQETVADVWPQLETMYDRAMVTGEAVSNVEIEWETPSDPGTLRHSLISCYPVRIDGEVLGLGIVLVDITDHLATETGLARASSLLATQTRILSMIASGSALRDTLNAITAEVNGQLPAVRSSIQMVGMDGTLEITAAASRELLACQHMEGKPVTRATICGSALLRDTAMIVDEPAGKDCWASQPCLSASVDVRKCWVTPIRRDPSGDPVGVLSCYFSAPYALDDRAQQLIETAAELAAVAIDRQRFEDQLSHQALHDQLTGRPNRALLVEHLRSDVARAARTASTGALLSIDLDRFKMVNDSLGHQVGDHVLREMARRITSEVRAEDTVARLSGDEFIVSCPDIRDDQESIRLAQRLLRAISQPLTVRSQELRLTASIGIAIRRPVDTRVDALLRNADIALYRAKNQGGDRWEMFDASQRKRAVHRLRDETALRRAVDDGKFEIWYQPVWSVVEERICSVEALVRWPQPRGQIASPATFIPLAEEIGVISKLGAWVLGRACAEGALLDREGIVLPRIAVNASGRQLTDGSLLPAVEAALAAAGWDPGRLAVEVTETAIVADPAAARATLLALRSLGVTVALDDFGTGFSSMSYLKDFLCVDVIKIDRTFVAGLADPASRDQAIVRATIALAQAVGATVVAEGVETVEQLQTLISLGCHLIQGFLVARPMPLGDLRTAMLEEPWRVALHSAAPVPPLVRLLTAS